MAKRKMSEEQRNALSAAAKARWAAKKAETEQQQVEDASITSEEMTNENAAQEDSQQIEVVVSVSDNDEKTEVTKADSDEDVITYVRKAREVMHQIRQKNPDVIEAVQAVDALDEAIARIGQVQGILASK